MRLEWDVVGARVVYTCPGGVGIWISCSQSNIVWYIVTGSREEKFVLVVSTFLYFVCILFN